MAKGKNQNIRSASVIEMGAGQFLRALNRSTQAKTKIYENVISRIGRKLGSELKLVALGNDNLIFENVSSNIYYRADYTRKKGGKIDLNNINRIRVVESDKSEKFSKTTKALVDAIAEGDSKLAMKHFGIIEALKFRPNVVSESGLVKTRDGNIRHIAVSSHAKAREMSDKITKYVMEAIGDRISVEKGNLVSASLSESKYPKLTIPIDELARRRIVARTMKEAAQNAYTSEAFQNVIQEWAALVSHKNVNEAVRKAAKFLKEYQEFTMLNVDESKLLAENALAASGHFNSRLADHIGQLIYAVNMRVNKHDMCESWRQAAIRTENPEFIENTKLLAESENFNNDYELFLESVFTEGEEDVTARAQAFTNAIKIILYVLKGEEGEEPPVGEEPAGEYGDLDLGAEPSAALEGGLEGPGATGGGGEEFKLESRLLGRTVIQEQPGAGADVEIVEPEGGAPSPELDAPSAPDIPLEPPTEEPAADETDAEKQEVITALEDILARLEETSGDDASVGVAEDILSNISDELMTQFSEETDLEDFKEMPGVGEKMSDDEGEEKFELGELEDEGEEEKKEDDDEKIEINVESVSKPGVSVKFPVEMDIIDLREERKAWEGGLSDLVAENGKDLCLDRVRSLSSRAKQLGPTAEVLREDFNDLAKVISEYPEMGMSEPEFAQPNPVGGDLAGAPEAEVAVTTTGCQCGEPGCDGINCTGQPGSGKCTCPNCPCNQPCPGCGGTPMVVGESLGDDDPGRCTCLCELCKSNPCSCGLEITDPYAGAETPTPLPVQQYESKVCEKCNSLECSCQIIESECTEGSGQKCPSCNSPCAVGAEKCECGASLTTVKEGSDFIEKKKAEGKEKEKEDKGDGEGEGKEKGDGPFPGAAKPFGEDDGESEGSSKTEGQYKYVSTSRKKAAPVIKKLHCEDIVSQIAEALEGEYDEDIPSAEGELDLPPPPEEELPSMEGEPGEELPSAEGEGEGEGVGDPATELEDAAEQIEDVAATIAAVAAELGGGDLGDDLGDDLGEEFPGAMPEDIAGEMEDEELPPIEGEEEEEELPEPIEEETETIEELTEKTIEEFKGKPGQGHERMGDGGKMKEDDGTKTGGQSTPASERGEGGSPKEITT